MPGYDHEKRTGGKMIRGIEEINRLKARLLDQIKGLSIYGELNERGVEFTVLNMRENHDRIHKMRSKKSVKTGFFSMCIKRAVLKKGIGTYPL
ncbi:hypothetical protein DI291_05865 [Bacillus paralicheniformis]|nr:hypothetical protein DI291_05865 [Bacillus paralicheniformis]